MVSGFESNHTMGRRLYRSGPLHLLRSTGVQPNLVWPALAVLIVAAMGTGPVAAWAADPVQLDVTGVWRVDIEHQRQRCLWQGQVRLDQDGTQLTGEGEAAATQAQRFCPRLKGDVAGSVNGERIKFGFATGPLGTGEFDGLAAASGRLLSGTWAAGRAAGTWRAERLD